ncbi:unnamed protein product [Larinioides sclopetarius]|uniref:Organic cation transporter 1 n=1 Tax=Larinioides sclopetarius TaxID=280406 RepID=A0AAV1ZDD7_9ARAC
MEFEDVLIEVGDYGKYQRNLIMIFLVPAASLLPWFSMNVLFMVSVPDHWCKVPGLSSFNLTMEQQKSLVAPPGEHCKRYDMNLTEMLDFGNYSLLNGSTTRPCDQGWEYDHTYWDSTASTKWDMVCDDAHYNSFVLTMYNVGSIIGTPIYGSLSDNFLPESPRWLVSQERYDEAATILYQIGEKNKKIVEKNELVQKLQKLGEKMKNEKTIDKVENSSLDLLRYPQLRKKFIIITFCWMANIMSYYGLQLNISNLAGNEFINFFLLGIAEIPGYLSSWFFMERFGRRWCSVTGFLLTGVVCMMSAIEFPYNDIVCSMLGKYFAALTFMATYQQSSELYPTVVRSLGMGMSSTVAMLVTLVVPYIVYLSIYGRAIPFIIIGGCGIVAGILATFLPETLNENLPQSINDAEKFGLNQKFFSWNRRRHSIGRVRAASIGFKVKPDGTGDGDNESKIHRSSQILQNVEFVPGSETTCVSVDSVNVLNGDAHNVRKRNSTDGYAKESYAIDTIPNVLPRNSVGEDKQRMDYTTQSGQELKQNIDDNKNDKLEGIQSSGSCENDKERFENKGPVLDGQDSNEKFSYVNMVFDNNDVVGTINDDVVIRDGKSGSIHSEYENSGKVDV